MLGRKRLNHKYSAYGTNIESEIRIDDLLPMGPTSSTDVQISFCRVSLPERKDKLELFESPGRTVAISENSMYIEWERVGRFHVSSGREILVDPDPGVNEADLQPLITGPVLSVLLHQRGMWVLHASAVSIENKAIAFLGSKGYGKSTLAAHLQMRGHQLISDDLVPVKFVRGRPITYPGYPRIKLNEDSIIAVGDRPDTFPLVHRLIEKRSFRPASGISELPIELSAVYVLVESTTISLEVLNPAAAFVELIKHSFLKRFLNAMNAQREHFHQCERLVRSVPIVSLGRPHDFAVIDEVCRQVENDASSLRPITR